MSAPTLLIVIPTRNRPDLALRAAHSASAEAPQGAHIVVSDNSVDSAAAAQLETDLADADLPNVRLVRSPADLAMAAHWQWVFDEVDSIEGWTHVTILTDRMVYKSCALTKLMGVLERRPSRIVSFNHDGVDDSTRPTRALCAPWTGELVEVQAARLLSLSSRMKIHPALPRMLNCAVPRSHLGDMRARFLEVFGSVAPDLCFAYRTLELVDSIDYLDQSLLIHSALDRSNGASYSRGEATPDQRDFMSKLGGVDMNHGAPVPAFRTTLNTCISEYALARRSSKSQKFPPIDERAYLNAIELEIHCIAEPGLRSEMLDLLWEERRRRGLPPRTGEFIAKLRHPLRTTSAVLANVVSHPPIIQAWLSTGAAPPRTRWLKFPDSRSALAFVDHVGRRRVGNHDALRSLQGTRIR